ncbi:MAG: transketolase [Candidatus Hydrothermales bacterium]
MELALKELLTEKALAVRRKIIKMIYKAGSGHPGGSLSLVEILVTFYFGDVLRYREDDPFWSDRDRLILSKGHGIPSLYSVWSEIGWIPEYMLWTLRKLNSPLQGHPDRRKLPLIEISSGSLGQGLSVGIGMALAGKIDKKDYRVYVIMGDGEMEEGQVWEAAMFAGFHKLNNLTALVDYNKFQLDGPIGEILNIEPLSDKWKSFGWEVFEVDGHSFDELKDVFDRIKENSFEKPQCVIAHTVKGKGVSFMENNNEFHGRAPTKEEALKALRELGEIYPEI